MKNIEKGEVFVYHNTPVEINSLGGNVVKQNIKEYEETREIFSIKRTSLTKEHIEQSANDLAHKKFDLLMFNCEHFVNFASSKKYVSGQVIKLTGIALLGILVYYLIKTKRI